LQGNAHNSQKPLLRLIREGFPTRPAYGTAVSETLLIRVAAGELGDTFRLHRPARELAFSKQDRAAAGFATAVQAAREMGFEPVVRLAGGRAALFHEGTLAIAWSSHADRPVEGTQERFRRLAELITRALRGLGVDAQIGEVPGEYCPGAWSISARGETKLVGIGQRMIRGGAHCGAVIVVSDSKLVRDTLEPVYEALELEWKPATTGAVEDEIGPTTLDVMEEAVIAELASEYELAETELDPETLERARELEASHRPAEKIG
jgi:octanoyl-[GcvH]:protein N-octanoyltransferase